MFNVNMRERTETYHGKKKLTIITKLFIIYILFPLQQTTLRKVYDMER